MVFPISFTFKGTNSLNATSYDNTFVFGLDRASQGHPYQGISLLRLFSPKFLPLFLQQRLVSDEVVGTGFEYSSPRFLLGQYFDHELIELVHVLRMAQIEEGRELFVDVFIPFGRNVEHLVRSAHLL